MSKDDVYELKKWYPSLPRDWEKGMRVGHGDYHPNSVSPVSIKHTNRFIPLSEIRTSKDFWVKLKPLTYKVINYSKGTFDTPDIFKVSSYLPLKVITPQGEEKEVLDISDYRIHSVERLSDSERFHLGSMVDYKEEAHEIRSFFESASIEDSGILVRIARPKLSAPSKNVKLSAIKNRPMVLNMKDSAKETAIKIMEECIEKLKNIDETSQ